MIDLSNLTECYKFFLIGLPIGAAIVTFFFIIGSVCSLLYGIMTRA